MTVTSPPALSRGVAIIVTSAAQPASEPPCHVHPVDAGGQRDGEPGGSRGGHSLMRAARRGSGSRARSCARSSSRARASPAASTRRRSPATTAASLRRSRQSDLTARAAPPAQASAPTPAGSLPIDPGQPGAGQQQRRGAAHGHAGPGGSADRDRDLLLSREPAVVEPLGGDRQRPGGRWRRGPGRRRELPAQAHLVAGGAHAAPRPPAGRLHGALTAPPGRPAPAAAPARVPAAIARRHGRHGRHPAVRPAARHHPWYLTRTQP